MNHERSRQMVRDGLRGFYLMMQRLDGKHAGEIRTDECSHALACIAYSVLEEVTGGDPRKLIGVVAQLMLTPGREVVDMSDDAPPSSLKGN